MADTLVTTSKSNSRPDGFSDSPAPFSNGSLFHRRIEFHLARKPFTGFSNGGGDFRLETLNPSSETQRHAQNQGADRSALAAKKSDGSEISETGLDPELGFRITFRRIGAGLENLGNTCFLNSVLQCLTYTEPLAAYLQSGKHQISCRTAGFCALCAIQKHVSRALQANGRILAPKDLVSNLRCISRNFRNARQEDAHEYMVNLLESMHRCSLPSGVPSESPGAYKKSLVHKIFGGQLRSQVKCMQCSFCSNKFDPFLDLSLEIGKADSLSKALAHFTARELLDEGARQYQCERCKQKVKAIKQLTVHEAPYVLTIHLKRFGSHVPGQKIDKKVVFGPTLDLKPFVSGPYDGDLKYTLYGVLVHAGWSTHSGHYYCFVRTSSGMWYYLDDNKVVQVNERRVLEQKAYMLFYFRDRRNFAPKKPVNIVQKDIVTMNALGNKAHSSNSMNLKEIIHDIPIEKKLNGAVSSVAVETRGALNAGAAKETMEKEASVQKINGPIMAKCNKNSSSVFSTNLPPLKDPEKELPVLNPSGGDCLPASAPSVRSSTDSLTLDQTAVTTSVEVSDRNHDRSTNKDMHGSVASPPSNSYHHNPCTSSVAMLLSSNEDRSTNKHLSAPVAMPTNCNVTSRSAGDISITHETKAQKSDSKAPLQDPSEKILDNLFPVKSLNLTCSEDSEAGGFPKCSAANGPRSEKAADIGQSMVDTEGVELSGVATTTNISLTKKAVDSMTSKKQKKKLLKCQITRTRLGSNILFVASLSLRKKKGHKRSKHRTLKVKKLTQEQFLDANSVPADLGPSTSEKTSTIIHSGSTVPRRKKKKVSSNMSDDSAVVRTEATTANINGDSSTSIIDEIFAKRVGHCGSMLATDEPSKKYPTSASVGNQWDSREANGLIDIRRDTTQNAVMSMLTRGLEETIVARWDGIELPPRHVTGANNGKSVSIGYVADEWDEEYDRGKRKKIRSAKNDFDGPNPFQEIATKKAKLNNTKKDRSSSGNRPFRI